jgi:hypothetical protein
VHDFRRSALSNMTEAGVSVPDAMSISGHKTVSTFLRYNIVSKQRKRDALRHKVSLRRASLQAFRRFLESFCSFCGNSRFWFFGVAGHQ